MLHIVTRSRLNISAETFWAKQSIATVNDELGPWIQMTAPSTWQNVRLANWGNQQPLFKSWVLFLGVVPIDRHAFGTFELSQPMQFIETSSSWLNRVWRHERTVTAFHDGCQVVDQVSFQPRLPFVSAMVKPIYQLVFHHRHARLRAHHAGTTLTSSSKN